METTQKKTRVCRCSSRHDCSGRKEFYKSISTTSTLQLSTYTEPFSTIFTHSRCGFALEQHWRTTRHPQGKLNHFKLSCLWLYCEQGLRRGATREHLLSPGSWNEFQHHLLHSLIFSLIAGEELACRPELLCLDDGSQYYQVSKVQVLQPLGTCSNIRIALVTLRLHTVNGLVRKKNLVLV